MEAGQVKGSGQETWERGWRGVGTKSGGEPAAGVSGRRMRKGKSGDYKV